MAVRSAGVLIHRPNGDTREILLVLPGGPWWRGRDAGAWQIPKGEIEAGEDPGDAARREVEEELGIALSGPLVPLATIRQAGGKWVEAFACEQDFDAAAVRSNSFECEWPPRSGKRRTFTEVAAARWFSLADANGKMLASQRPLLNAFARLTE